MGKVRCTKLAPWSPEKEAPARLHTFGLSLWAFGGAVQGEVMLLCAARMCPIQHLAQGDSVRGQGLEGGNVIYSNGSG